MSNPDSPIKISPSNWPKGSEWRRWDPHVHTPESKLGSPFGSLTWDGYLDALETAAADSEISVIGVTDYMTIDGYEKLLMEHRENDRLKSVDLLIPNIEFRMMPQTDDGKALNLHLLVDPSDPDHVDRIKRALRNLKFEYDGEKYGCCREELIEFGKVQDPASTDDERAYKFGIEQFKPDRTVIKDWLDKEKWLRTNSLVGIANGKDGISGLPLDGFGATRDEILKWCDFVFSGNPSDQKHYLGLKASTPVEEIIRQYRSLKPCIHGSDAHDVETLFKPDENRFCWIKSDPSFHGLRQILWEPADRTHVGEQPPRPTDQSQQIRRITISNASGWFSTGFLELNPGLVAVIGEKGAGKTAIADLAAFAAGFPMDPNSQSSFITKGALHLPGTKVELEWGGGEVTEGTLTDSPFIESKPRVRYLSQDFVERLCSSDHEGTELQNAIEDVVFAKLDEIQKEGYSSFGELRKAREAASNIQKESLRGDQATLHKEVERLQDSIDQRPSKVKAKAEAEKQAEELKKQLPDATQSVDKNILEDLEKQQALLNQIEEDVSTRTRRRRVIETSLESFSAVRKSTDKEIGSIQRQLRNVDVTEATVNALAPTWSSDAEGLLEKEIEKIDAEITTLKGSADDDEATRSVFAVKRKISALRETVAKDEVSRKRLLDLQKQISERTKSAERLDKEIKNLDEKVSATLAKRRERQIDLYLEVFKALSADEEVLKELYAPLREAIDQLGEEMQFSVSVGYQIDAKSWLAQSSRFFDGRRVGAESKRNEIEKIVETKLAPAWKSGDPAEIEPTIKEFIAAVDPKTFPSKYGTANMTEVQLNDWLFSVEHVELTYKIHYAGTQLEYLSPGTRGIALLVLYLLMDEDDTRPLLIDQPEGNLDNSSVYKQLVPYIRKAKTRRQIILITHNPNLVVATDAEQIVVATAERPSTQPYPCLRYDSGSLEHSVVGDDLGIREAVCLLLEGGEEAFKARERRYSLANQ
ncbi:MAG: AAA family ATPase [Verrucomicrobiales bacterium]|nr:AAA family ATPase [Verrucomicrobiales bacterium]